MPITFKYRGATFTADTPKEAAETLAILRAAEAEEKQRRLELRAFMNERISRAQTYMKESQAEFAAYYDNFLWTRDRFTALIGRLGEAQKLALALLVTKQNISDEELRNALEVPNNQALAGVLSGISKQAASLFIPPRAIFDFENSRVGGKRRSDYVVADQFRHIAAEMNWPPSSLLAVKI